MKRILFLCLTFLTLAVSAQTPFPNTGSISNDSSLYQIRGATKFAAGFIVTAYADTAAANRAPHISYYPGFKIRVGNTEYMRDSTATRWLVSSGLNIPAGAIAAIPVVGTNPGTDLSPSDWIINTFYVAAPTATISGGVTLPFQSAATLNYTLNYSSGRAATTKPLSTIVVAGQSETFTQPSAPGTVSGTQSVSFAANTNITYSNVTTATDGKSATATTTFAFLPERFVGWLSDTTGIGTTGFDDTKITALTSDLSASKSKSWSTGNPTGTQFLVYAYYSPAGALTQFDMNGFPSLEAMNSVTRTFTTEHGYTGTYYIYWSKNGQTLFSTVVAN